MSEIEAIFDISPLKSTIIMVAGIGGGGGNAVNHMFRLGAADVSFMVCNTDKQALERSPVPNRILLGNGLGAGNRPEKGREAAEASIDEIAEALMVNETKMLFVTAGMGGGTGTGAAPVVARVAKEMGILTVGIVSIPFKDEGPKRITQAIEGIRELGRYVDSLIVIDNEHIAENYPNLGASRALAKADDILANAARSIAEIITIHSLVNVDMADVTTVMANSGVALMGTAEGSGENRALEAAKAAVNSPLLHHNSIVGAQDVLINITSAEGEHEVSIKESQQIVRFIQEEAGLGAKTDVIWGLGYDDTLERDIRVTVVATGFNMDYIPLLTKNFEDILEPQVRATVPGADQAGVRQVVELDMLEVPVAKKAPDEGLVDGFELVTRSGGDGVVAVAAQEEARSERVERIEPRVREVVIEPVSENAMIHVDESTLETPAWKRRKMTLYSEPRDPAIKSERLEGTTNATSAAQAEASNVSLFDN